MTVTEPPRVVGEPPVTPPDLAALVESESIRAAAVRLAALVADAPAWSEDARRVVLHRLDRAVDVLAAARAAVLVAERKVGAWQDAGDRSFEAWRGRTGRTGERCAAAQVRQAEGLAAVPTVAEAVVGGRIGLEHAAVIGKLAAGGTPAQQRAASSPSGQEQLLGLAQDVDAGAFATAVSRWAATVDPEALEVDRQAQRRERYLHLTDSPRGTFLKGRLDHMPGHRVRLALEALTPRPAADDDRDPGQRCADALETMAETVLGSADTKPGAHVPPHVSLIVSAETWVAARAHRDRRRAEAPGTAADLDPGEHPGSVATDEYPPATLEDGTPVAASEVAAVMCDCAITRIAVDAAGVPLDLGRTRRLFTGEQRRAVIARDRECSWPGCHMHARWCQIHHIKWWERDTGPTSVDGGVLACSFHHHEIHGRDLTVTRLVAPPCEAGPPGARVAASRVTYTFTDRTGRAVAPVAATGRAP